MPSLRGYLETCIDAAYLGGKRTLAYFNTGVDVETKSNDTPVTIADKEAELVIRERIKRDYASHSIIGEEGGLETGDAEMRWIIDPLDGTKSFIRGVPLYGTLVALEIEGVASVGAVYLPVQNEMLYAAKGMGAFLNGRVARVSNTKNLSEATLLTTSSESCRKRGSQYDALASRVQLTRGWGDCFGYVLVATGRADIMLDAGMNVWDCAPMLPILKEAGGHFTTWAGVPTIHGSDAVGTNDALHGQVLELLAG
jgi:myo-inositol-1(or 4)-monophosphatase